MPQIPSKSHLIGLISLIIVVLLWLLASILTQDILLQYNKPSLLAFLSVASMQVYFAFLAFEDPLQNYLEAESAYTKVRTEDTLNSAFNSALNSTSNSIENVDTKHSDSLETHVNMNMDMITLKQTAVMAAKLFLVYFVGLYFMNASLKYTTLGSSSILNSTCSFFTLFLGILFKTENFTLIKGAAVVVTFAGVLVNSLPGAKAHERNAAYGDILALSGAIFYAIFLVALQKQTQTKIGLNRSVLFAFIGFFTMITCWPLLLVGREDLELPPNQSIYIYLLLKIFLGSVIPSYLWNVAFALTSPLYIAVGTSLTIPINFVADYFMGNAVGLNGCVGAIIVTIGCLLMNFNK